MKKRAEACSRLDAAKIRGFLARGTRGQLSVFDISEE
jgi:hypothetical protein